MYRRLAAIAVGLILGGLLAVPQAKADPYNVVTIKSTGPLEVPGRVLPAGTYKIRPLDPAQYDDVVEVVGQNGAFYGFYSVIPDYRQHATDRVKIDLQKEAGSPDRIEAWFDPGSHMGMEFVYPQSREVRAAHNIQPTSNRGE